jgi:hypothetical protein
MPMFLFYSPGTDLRTRALHCRAGVEDADLLLVPQTSAMIQAAND